MALKLEKCKSALHFKTQNVRTLYQPGAALALVKETERLKVDILALQEIRCQEEGSLEIENTALFYGICGNRRQCESGFSVHKYLVPAIRDFKVIYSKLTGLTLEAKWFKIEFFNAHAPLEKKNDEEK